MAQGLYLSNLQLSNSLLSALDNVESTALPAWDDPALGVSLGLANCGIEGEWVLPSSISMNNGLTGSGAQQPRAVGAGIVRRRSPRYERIGSQTGEYTHLKHKTIPWPIPTRITTLACATAIGSSARYDSTSRTIYIQETSERVIESVELETMFRTEFPSTTTINLIRLGIQMGSGPTVDVDKPWSVGSQPASRNQYWRIKQDITEYAKQWITPGTTSLAVVASLAVQASQACNVNQISQRISITYAFAANSNTNTRMRVLRIPLQSCITNTTTSALEVGTDGVSPAPTQQIPNLSTFIKEQSPTIRSAVLCVTANDMGVTTAITPQYSFDGGADTARATIDGTVANSLPFYDQFDLIAAGLSTSAAHSWLVKCDLVTSNKLMWVGAILEVVYEYDHAVTVTANLATYCGMYPLTGPDEHFVAPSIYGSVDFSTQPPNQALNQQSVSEAFVTIPEPGTITMLQSAVISHRLAGSAGGGTTDQAQTQNQLPRVSTNVGSLSNTPVIHRVDITNGWTLQRGSQRLSFYFGNAGHTYHTPSYAIINYSAGVNGDVDDGTHMVQYIAQTPIATPTNAPLVVNKEDGGVRPPILGRPYNIMSAMVVGEMLTNTSVGPTFIIDQNAGELDQLLSYESVTILGGGTGFAATPLMFPMGAPFNRTDQATGKCDIEARRRQIMHMNVLPFFQWSWWITYHQYAYAVSGSLLNGASPIVGATVNIYAVNSGNATRPMELVTTAVTDGSGNFAATVRDDTKSYFASYEDDVVFFLYGRSPSRIPGAGALNIQVGSGGGGGSGYSRGRVVNL